MIVATAGHVDHGKTSLVKHLTGVDTDSLAEEKRRGLTIELGFAYRKINPELTMGFIDVPGHSRFINTMIGGVSGIDLGMLVVAADDGPMPQTREHLDVMRLLGVTEILVVVTKIDRVDPARVAQVIELVNSLVPECAQVVLPVSNMDEQGIPELKVELEQRALAFRARGLAGNFRLPVDRAFTLKGVGLIVTGSAVTGQVTVGDELDVFPGGSRVRVRSLRVQNTQAELGRAGERCALNIAGDGNIVRGSILATVDSLHSTTHVDVSLSVLASSRHTLKHLTPVKLYLGTRRLACRIFFIDKVEAGGLIPGNTALVQLILSEPVVCCTGDRFLVRDDSESIILGGGVVLDPAAPKEGKSREHRLKFLAAMRQPTPEKSLEDLLAPSMPPVNVTLLGKNWNMPQEKLVELLSQFSAQCFDSGPYKYAASRDSWRGAQRLILLLLNKWHKKNAQSKGVNVRELQTLFVSTQVRGAGEKLFKALISGLLRDRKLVLAGGLISAAHHEVVLSSKDRLLWGKIQKVLSARGILIPSLSELTEETEGEREQIRNALQASARINLVFKLNETRYGLAGNLLTLAKMAQELSNQQSGLTVISFKNKIGAGRKLAIDILEYFDTLQYTQRRGDIRVVINPEVPQQVFALANSLKMKTLP